MLTAKIQLELPAWIHQEIDSERLYADDEARIELAIALSRHNVEKSTGGPFGAAIFDGAGRLISVGVNQVLTQKFSIAHAEMLAMMTAQASLRRFRLNENGERYVLATSSQPCCQCYGASVWAGIDELLIGASADDVQELTEFDEGPLPLDWVGELTRRGIAVKRDIQRSNARAVLKLYSERGGQRY